MSIRDDLDRVLCHHGRPFTCGECGEEYAAEVEKPLSVPAVATPVEQGKADPSRKGFEGAPDGVEALIREMRTIAMVAGQASVEGPRDFLARQSAREAERASRWADELEALLAASRLRPSPEPQEDVLSVRGEDFWLDELEYQLGRPLTPTGKGYLRTWLLAFAAHVKRQRDG